MLQEMSIYTNEKRGPKTALSDEWL